MNWQPIQELSSTFLGRGGSQNCRCDYRKVKVAFEVYKGHAEEKRGAGDVSGRE